MRTLSTLALITQNESMRQILARIDRVVESDSTILLIGETGVGKEIFAEYIHRISPRSQQSFVKVGLSAISPNLLETELFGHEKGAFTGASNKKIGLFELAHQGSIFLDDIDDVSLDIQSKLLRVLESNELMRVGGTATIPINVRLIAATKVDLKQLVNRGLFRSDLFYRINVVPVVIPPLRERTDDIPLIIDHFLKRFAPDKELTVSMPALHAFKNYSWPGNVRELRNVIQRIALFVNQEIQLSDLPPEICSGNTVEMLVKACLECFVDGSMKFEEIVSCLETNLMDHALKKSGGNRSKAADILGLKLSTFRDKLKKYNMEHLGEETGVSGQSREAGSRYN